MNKQNQKLHKNSVFKYLNISFEIENFLWTLFGENSVILYKMCPAKCLLSDSAMSILAHVSNKLQFWGNFKTLRGLLSTSEVKNIIFWTDTYTLLGKGSLAVKKVQFFWTLFKKPLTPPPFVWTLCGEFFWRNFNKSA